MLWYPLRLDKDSLHLIVLMKDVPDIEKVKFNLETMRIDRSSAPNEINPFDLHALEEAVRLKEKYGGVVTAISMGPPMAEKSLREALARGADRAILLSDRRFAGSDTLATSYTLACAIRKLESYDLILTGEKTVDGDTGQVGPEVAEHLGIPNVPYVIKIQEISGGYVIAESMLDSEIVVYRSTLPALISVTKDINFPRIPTLRDKIKARKVEVTIWKADDLSECSQEMFGFRGSPTNVARVDFPTIEGRRGVRIDGDPDTCVEKLLKYLSEEGVI